mmetsp:Transcript_10232/g.42241  ORF Transcript_10232/g.42241 Transcript_10232/m.42241 type:complete len:209 (-) Transcript_10232:5537-6163(-)
MARRHTRGCDKTPARGSGRQARRAPLQHKPVLSVAAVRRAVRRGCRLPGASQDGGNGVTESRGTGGCPTHDQRGALTGGGGVRGGTRGHAGRGCATGCGARTCWSCHRVRTQQTSRFCGVPQGRGDKTSQPCSLRCCWSRRRLWSAAAQAKPPDSAPSAQHQGRNRPTAATQICEGARVSHQTRQRAHSFAGSKDCPEHHRVCLCRPA